MQLLNIDYGPIYDRLSPESQSRAEMRIWFQLKGVEAKSNG